MRHLKTKISLRICAVWKGLGSSNYLLNALKTDQTESLLGTHCWILAQLLRKQLQNRNNFCTCCRLNACSFIFQAVINSTTTDDGDAPSLNADVSTIPVLEVSTATTVQSVLHDDPPVLHSLEIPTPALVDSHDSAMGDLIGMTRRSDEHSTYE